MTSAINPNNIDGAYPVAGQDNNSQGFRDNFTNTKTNFQYAADEITDLQNKVVLKAALTGTTLNNNMQGSILSNVQLQYSSQTVVNLSTLSGTVTVNYSAGSYQSVVTGGSISLAFSNWTAAGTQDCLQLQVTVSSTAHTMTLPAAVGAGASATSIVGIEGLDSVTNTVTFDETGTYIFQFITADSGSSIYISELTRPRNYFSNNIYVNTGIVNGGLEVVNPYYADITANAQTVSLSTTTSTNFLVANNTGYTTIVNMPSSPVDGQITRFAVSGNTVTLVAGTGTVSPTFAGSVTTGTGYKYVYRNSDSTWYKSI